MEFDYVIVGAGSAGCAIANRLSARSDISVALLEAGGEDRSPWIHIPVGYFKTMGNPKTDWCYKTEADPGLNGRAINWPRGKVLGGSSSINGQCPIAPIHLEICKPYLTAAKVMAQNANMMAKKIQAF